MRYVHLKKKKVNENKQTNRKGSVSNLPQSQGIMEAV
jgi:hypothetical protein